jgi:ABC-type transporter Mla MlaB component
VNRKADHPSAEAAISVVWQGDCCIDSVSSRLDELVRAVGERRPLRVDAREVTRIDTAGLQLLVAFALEAQRRALLVEWVGVSEAVWSAARLANLCEPLGLHEP